MADDPAHIPVLLDEALGLLDPKPGEIAVDCTAGCGGHSAALAEAVKPDGRVIGFDLDPQSLATARERLRRGGGRFEAVHDSYVRVAEHLAAHSLRADVVVADLGVSSRQLADPSAGFSFTTDGPLDMRFDQSGGGGGSGGVTAADLLAALSEPELARLIREYGEDPYARKIARKLVQSRKAEPIRSTAQLARLVQESYGPRAHRSRRHPATRTFMALRIAVNDELGALRSLLEQVIVGAEALGHGGGWLKPAARVAIISFHSQEDRLVKHSFAELARRGLATRLTKRPVTPSPSEVRANPRSRSAKLRAVRIISPAAA
ncbi:MAG: 16S rRNA (cytosine(1402)-N(4))-methyltransferase RsmH [Planctomycetota bacterium]|jgi:16S rRNA (cytosine1402-N4)-methyltransferase